VAVNASPELSVLDRIGAHLRSSGWADFVTVDRLLRDWQWVAREAGQYQDIVDDYTNDVTARDGLEIVLGECRQRCENDFRR
jgi:hypothetical protein